MKLSPVQMDACQAGAKRRLVTKRSARTTWRLQLGVHYSTKMFKDAQ